jgi:hypothetical protein
MVSNCIPTRNLARFAVIPLAFLLATGCETLRPSTPVSVTIRDAETKAPVPGAEVAFLYPTTNDSTSKPKDVISTTDATGIAQIRGVTSDDGLPQVKVTAPGYIVEQRGLPGDALHAMKENNSFWSITSHHDPIFFEMLIFHGPPAVIELTVPVGYRGLIKADVRVREDIVYQRDQRLFTGTVVDGAVTVDGSPLLKSDYKPIFRARYGDDVPVPVNVQDNEVGFRWLRTEGRTELFVIGTRAELEALRRSTEKANSGDSGGKKNGGGGGGGGGRHGGGGGGGNSSSGTGQ